MTDPVIRTVYVVSHGYLLDGEPQAVYSSLELAKMAAGMDPGRWRTIDKDTWAAQWGDTDKCRSIRRVEFHDAG